MVRTQEIDLRREPDDFDICTRLYRQLEDLGYGGHRVLSCVCVQGNDTV